MLDKTATLVVISPSSLLVGRSTAGSRACSGPGSSAAIASVADQADGRPGLHPERPVRPVLPRPAAGLLPRRRSGRDLPEPGRPDLITLVGQGALDVGIADGTSVIPAVGQGIPIRYVATIYARFPNVVMTPAASGLTTAASLAGHSLGIPGRYGSSWVMLQALLASAGLTPSDIDMRAVPRVRPGHRDAAGPGRLGRRASPTTRRSSCSARGSRPTC